VSRQKFKVYNGELEPVHVIDEMFLLMPPVCTALTCRKRICDWMSNEYCFDHATAYVKEYDRKKANGEWTYDF
jgi:hypothetical protein